MEKQTTIDHTDVIEAVDPARVLESVVSELEVLLADAPLGTGKELVSLYGALLLFNLGGWSDLLPSVGLSLNRRRSLEGRVVRAARRVVPESAGAHPAEAAEAAMVLAGAKIDELLHLIDPELRRVAA